MGGAMPGMMGGMPGMPGMANGAAAGEAGAGEEEEEEEDLGEATVHSTASAGMLSSVNLPVELIECDLLLYLLL